MRPPTDPEAPPTCLGLPPGPERRALAPAEERLQRRRPGAPPKVADVTAFDPPGLLKQPESDVLLLEAFVYVCRSAGL